MIFTDNQWRDAVREVKLGRVFHSNDCEESSGDAPRRSIVQSEYTAHLGSSLDFLEKFRTSTEDYGDLAERLVFISDGARWIDHWIVEQYPESTRILDSMRWNT